MYGQMKIVIIGKSEKERYFCIKLSIYKKSFLYPFSSVVITHIIWFTLFFFLFNVINIRIHQYALTSLWTYRFTSTYVLITTLIEKTRVGVDKYLLAGERYYNA